MYLIRLSICLALLAMFSELIVCRCCMWDEGHSCIQ